MMLDILFAVAEGEAKPTRIMSKANLPWKKFSEKLDCLTSQGLIHVESDDSRRRVYITQNGKKVINNIQQFVCHLTQVCEGEHRQPHFSKEIRFLTSY